MLILEVLRALSLGLVRLKFVLLVVGVALQLVFGRVPGPVRLVGLGPSQFHSSPVLFAFRDYFTFRLF